MNKPFKFQVVIMDKKGYILEYMNFEDKAVKHMLEYVALKCLNENVNKFEITRWNDKGERE